MLLGVIFNKKKYSTIKYLCIIMIVCGVGLFLYKDSPNKTKTADTTTNLLTSFKLFDTVGIGELLVVSVSEVCVCVSECIVVM